ncbi:KdsC family phosphatase [Thermodesulfobacteriota bacterium]
MVTEKLKQVKLLLLDVDGVLTTGGIVYNDNGTETKVFNVRDGLGIRLLMEAGISVGIITGRTSGALSHRCQDLGIHLVFDAVGDKAAVLEQALAKSNATADETAFVGDDLPDLPIMNRVGVAIAVADGHETILENADVITSATGGNGAVREVCEEILKAQGLWRKTIERFF